jgi:lipid-A-disaccharide synthase
VLVSAGEASGDLYASEVVKALARLRPDVQFFGCAGPRMEAAGVAPTVHASALSVVGLVEVVTHIPRIYGEFRKLVREAERRRPKLAILTDSPDFNLRLAARLKRMGIPVLYLVAPQVWAWREGRVRQMRRDIDHLLCIFPFEECWFQDRGVRATYVGHPLARLARPSCTRDEFRRRHDIGGGQHMVLLLPGSRVGEVSRHLPMLIDAASHLRKDGAEVVMALPGDFARRAGPEFFRERIPAGTIQVIEGETWNAIAAADLCLAASGTVTVEAAVLGAPMVTFYRVSPLSWKLGRGWVRVPFLTMVNLIAGRQIVPELMQDDANGARLAAEATTLLNDRVQREEMKTEIGRVAALLASDEDPIERAARAAAEFL